MNARSRAGLYAGLLVVFGTTFALIWVFHWQRWWEQLIAAAAALILAFPAGVIGGWLANGRKPI